MSQVAMPSVTALSFLLACALCAVAVQGQLRQQAPFQPTPTINLPRPAPDNQRHGNIGGWIDREKGVGTSVHVQGQGDAWVSRNGNSRLGVDGHYGQVVSGPARGAKDFGASVKFQHRF